MFIQKGVFIGNWTPIQAFMVPIIEHKAVFVLNTVTLLIPYVYVERKDCRAIFLAYRPIKFVFLFMQFSWLVNSSLIYFLYSWLYYLIQAKYQECCTSIINHSRHKKINNIDLTHQHNLLILTDFCYQ